MEEINVEEFSRAEFNAEAYVRTILSKCDIYRTLYDQRNAIKQLGDDTAVSLKKNVYRNYRQFIDTAKEISYLEAEMYQLSHLLTEQKSILSDQIETYIFECPKGVAVRPVEKKDADRKQAFLARLKASKSLLAELECKELILDGQLEEYDPETYSSVHKISAWLLTDNLIITSFFKPDKDGKVNILSMFDLSDLAVVNVRDGQGAKNAFKILYSLETRMFSAPSKEMKLSWLDKIEKAKKNYGGTQKLSELQIKEDEEEETAPEEAEIISEIKEAEEIEVEHSESHHQAFPDLLKVDWLLELPEDLDMCIAQRDFDGAVHLVEKGRSYLADFPDSPTLTDITNKIDNRLATLVSALEKSLDNSTSSRHVSLRSIRVYVQQLIRVGRSKLACELFLKNRGFEIKNSFKQLKMEGAVAMYIKKLANVFFTAIIETGKEYKRNFQCNKNSSAFVVWSHLELQRFADKFSRQVFTRNTSLSAIATCINITLAECTRLEQIGLDLSFDLQQMFLKDVMSVMFDTRDQILERGKLRAMEDDWVPVSYKDDPEALYNLQNEVASIGMLGFEKYVNGVNVQLSASTTTFLKDVSTFVSDGVQLYNEGVHSTFVQCVCDVFTAQAVQFESLLKNFTSNKTFIMENAEFVFGKVLHHVKSCFEGRLGCEPSMLTPVKKEILKLRKI